MAKSGTIDFAPGETLHSVLVSVTGDDALELDETFDVQISSPVHATLGNATTVVTITNNDPIPPGSAILNVTGASVREGKIGTTRVLTFTIVRSGETTTAVDVDVATTNGSAIAPTDYLSVSANVAFGANETTKTVDVTVVGDRRLERKETFFLSLLDPSIGAAIEHGQATGHIATATHGPALRHEVGHPHRGRGRVSPTTGQAGRGEALPDEERLPGSTLHPSAEADRDERRERRRVHGQQVRHSVRTAQAGFVQVIATFVGGTTFSSSTAIRRFRC